MAPVRSAFWDTPYVFVDHPRRPFLRREHCRLCLELSDRRRYRRCRPRMAAPGRRVVCAADGVPLDYRVNCYKTNSAPLYDVVALLIF